MAKNSDIQGLIDDFAGQIEADLATLEAARDVYYDGGDAIMTDAEYDALEDTVQDNTAELKRLASKHPVIAKVKAFFAKVGAKASTKWKKVKHGAPMGSLLKVQTGEEMRKWFVDTAGKVASAAKQGDLESGYDDQAIVTEKLDGISLSLRYEKGKLKQAITRGDGETGEDITRNVLLMKGVKEKIKDFTGYVRAEIVLKKSDHQKHVPEYKNPRNAASGIAKRESDPGPCKYLTVITYQVISDKHNISSKSMELKLLEALGFLTPFWKPVDGADDIAKIYEGYIRSKRDKLDYEIDGLVVEFNDLAVMEYLGEHDGRPKGARAFKFPHAQQKTKLKEIRWQVGNSGRVTPVAIFEAVDLAGATVTNASLHNVTNIHKLAASCPQELLGIGDTILVSRRNDVIPYVEKVISPAQNLRFTIPKSCPSCDKALKKVGEYLMCPNTKKCPAQQVGAIKRWVAKLDIKEWGDSLIKALCQDGYVKNIADLYRLQAGDLADLELSEKRLGESNAKKAIKNLHDKMEIRIGDFVGSLGIELCGQSICQILVDAGFDTLEKMEDATVAELEAVPGMGDTKAKSFVKGYKQRVKLIEDLLSVGVKVKGPVQGKLTGKSFCFTGIRDKGLESEIKDAGGAIKGSVGKSLTYLVAKDPKSNSGKAKKAKDYGVEVIGIEEVKAML
jgi:DNA ligase (NAD+)